MTSVKYSEPEIKEKRDKATEYIRQAMDKQLRKTERAQRWAKAYESLYKRVAAIFS